MKLGRRQHSDSDDSVPAEAVRVLVAMIDELNLVQKEMGRRIGFSQPTWSRVKTGNRKLTKEELQTALNALEISRADFDRRVKLRSLPSGKLKWVVAARDESGVPLNFQDVMTLLGIAPSAMAVGSEGPGVMRGAGRSDGKRLAQRVRFRWGLGSHAPIGDMSMVLGPRSIILLPAEISQSGSGILTLRTLTHKREIIVVPDKQPPDEQRWAAAEMLAGLRRRFRSADLEAESGEKFVADFAREFLLPESAIDLLLERLVRRKHPNHLIVAAVKILAEVYGAPISQVWRIVLEQDPSLERCIHLAQSDPPRLRSVVTNPWLGFLRCAENWPKPTSPPSSKT